MGGKRTAWVPIEDADPGGSRIGDFAATATLGHAGKSREVTSPRVPRVKSLGFEQADDLRDPHETKFTRFDGTRVPM